jgi:hypothetical protein
MAALIDFPWFAGDFSKITGKPWRTDILTRPTGSEYLVAWSQDD